MIGPAMDAVAPIRLAPVLQALWYGAAPYSFFDRARRRHGDVFTMRIIGEDWTLVADPALVREIVTADPEVVHAGEANQVGSALIGTRNLLTLDGSEHLRRRKLLLPPFHGERMQAYRGLMVEAADRELDAWPRGRPEPALRHMQDITFEVILRAMFGLDEAARVGQLGRSLRAVLDWVQTPRIMAMFLIRGPQWLDTYAPFRRMVDDLDRQVLGEIARRRQAPDLDRREDILSLLLLARSEDGEGLPDRDVRDELLALLAAGHETTASALAWALHFLARDPVSQERLRAGEAGFAEAVVQETLRLRPPLPFVVRLLKGPLTVGGRELPAGTRLVPSSALIHRDPAIYPDPEAFRPQRFLGAKPGTYEWLPFGGGVRRCIGAAFAQVEARVVLERVIARCSVRPYCARPEGIGRRGMVLIPRRHARVVLEDRH
jgi:cytochrome P450